MNKLVLLTVMTASIVSLSTINPVSNLAYAQVTYTITDIGTLNGNESYARAINNSGQVVGEAPPYRGLGQGFLWDSVNGMQDIGSIPGNTWSYARDINNSGQITGSSAMYSWGHYKAFLWDSDNGMQNIHPASGGSSAMAINDNAQIVGYDYSYNAFIWDSINGMQDIGTLGGYYTFPYGINNSGQVVGRSRPDTVNPYHAFIWDSINGMQDLNELIPENSGWNVLGQATDISDYGRVVGTGVLSGNNSARAFIWDSNNGIQNIHGLGYGSYANAVNAVGHVVGYADLGSGIYHAFIWDSINGMQDLNELIPENSEWTLIESTDINDLGQIVGYGTIDGIRDRAFLLTPTIVSQPISIDIKPGSDPNSINPGSKGVISVAILTTDNFDATTVDPLSVEFGPAAAIESHGKGHIEDIDGDGDFDLVLHFKTRETGITCGDTEGVLTGETFNGQAIEGFDSINIVRCN